jgi:hypothetical protein
MSVNAIQRSVTIGATFDVLRVNKEHERYLKPGQRDARFIQVYDVSINPKDHSIDQGDLLAQIGDAFPHNEPRYTQAEVDKARLHQLPAVTSNVRGLHLKRDEFMKKYTKDLATNEHALRRAARDVTKVLGFARYACEYDQSLAADQQKDVAILIAGTIDHCVQQSVKAGQLLVWDMPLPSHKTLYGSRVAKKKTNKLSPVVVPIEHACRLTLEMLISYCFSDKVRKVVPLAAQNQGPEGGDFQNWLNPMKEYIRKNGGDFWSTEGEFLNEMFRSQEHFTHCAGFLPQDEVREFQCFDNWMLKIYRGFQLKNSVRKAAWQHFSTMVDRELFGLAKPMLDCYGRLVGRCTRGAEAGKYADILIEML